MWNKNKFLYGGVGESVAAAAMAATESSSRMRFITFLVFIFTFYIIFVAIVANYAPAFLGSISGLIRTIICIFFLISYQPFGGKTSGIDELNKSIVWVGILFIFLSNIINETIIQNLKSINSAISKFSTF